MEPNPLITIITITKNSGKNLIDCLNSIDGQSYRHIQHLVKDGCSDDDTMQILDRHKSINRLVYQSKDTGIYDALNQALDKSDGEIVGFLHSDDAFSSYDTIACVAKYFENSNIDVVYGDISFVNQKEKIVRYWRAGTFERWKLALGWMPPHTSVFLRREILKEFGNFDISFKISGDYEHILRVFSSKEINIKYMLFFI